MTRVRVRGEASGWLDIARREEDLSSPEDVPDVGDVRARPRVLREALQAELRVSVVVGADEDRVRLGEERRDLARHDVGVVLEHGRASPAEDLDRLEGERVPRVVDVLLEGEAEDRD